MGFYDSLNPRHTYTVNVFPNAYISSPFPDLLKFFAGWDATQVVTTFRAVKKERLFVTPETDWVG
jgi:hypothetical protein